MIDTNILITPALRNARAAFAKQGFNLYIVGGACRDLIMGHEPKDVDMCTDATPDEQIAIYQANQYRYFLTGLAHGTITVVLDGEPYEITSMRMDQDCDGRHATVSYTRDLKTDLERRDLTFNAIAMDFDGNIIDPFDGVSDLTNKRARMVGNAEDRFLEDYLRILRFFRFHARFAGGNAPDGEALAAIKKLRDGLKTISVERIWAEIGKIITGPFAAETLRQIFEAGVAKVIGLPMGNFEAVKNATTKNPAAVMGLFLSPEQLDKVANSWKWSRHEKLIGKFIAMRKNERPTDAEIKALIVDGWDRTDVREWLNVVGYPTNVVDSWPTPKFPVAGETLMARGLSGKELGQEIKRLKQVWADSDYTISERDLINS